MLCIYIRCGNKWATSQAAHQGPDAVAPAHPRPVRRHDGRSRAGPGHITAPHFPPEWETENRAHDAHRFRPQTSH